MEIDIQENIIGIANVDCSSQVLTLFERLPVQKDTLFKTLNSGIVLTLFKTQDLENNTLFSSTYTYRPNMGVPRSRSSSLSNSSSYSSPSDSPSAFIFGTTRFVCVHRLFDVSVTMTSNSFYVVKLPTNSGKSMFFQVEVKFFYL